MKKRIGIQGFLVFFALFLSILLSKTLFPSWHTRGLDEFFDCIGMAVLLTGFLFRISARGHKSEKSGDGKNLVTDGPYSLMRHPMYFGTLLIGTGVILVLFAWWTFPLFLVAFLLIYIPQIRKEERLLSERFGDEYKSYFRDTPKYFPRLSSLLTTDFRVYLFVKAPWFKKEAPSLIGVIIVLMALEIWEHALLFGRIVYYRELIGLSFVAAFFVIVFSLLVKK